MSANYENIILTINDLDRIKLPKFQRGFVWTNSKKNDFVETLHRGFPFGALLVYPESQEVDSKLILLDGQQRLSTIQQYSKNPLKFWKPLNKDRYDETLKNVNALLDEEDRISDNTFDELVNGKRDLSEWTDDVAEFDKATRKELRELIQSFRCEIDEYVDLDSLSIFAIKFIGSRDCIADVFANLNKGGVPLSKYEIYNAAWIDTEIQLLGSGESKEEDSLLSKVKDYYNKMEDSAEFELNDFSEDELSRNRQITLSELGYALGAFISENLGALVPESTTTQQEIGFGVLGIITGTDNRQLSTLNKMTDVLNQNLQIYLDRIVTICADLQSIFSKLLNRVMAGKSNEYSSGLTASFKTLSYFAALWGLDQNSNEYQQTLANIPSYYVYDFWAGNWSSHGDQRLLGYYPANRKRTYLEPISNGQMKDAYTQWASDTTPGINFAKEIKALTTIHANLTYLSETIPYGEDFELEHIIAKKLVKEAEGGTTKKIFAGALGNCMYLPKKLNNKKKEKNLYAVNEDRKYDKLIQESLYFSEDEMDRIMDDLESRDYDDINALISLRGDRVAKSIAERLLQQNQSA